MKSKPATKEKVVHIRVRASEYALVEWLAREHGLTVSSFLHSRLIEVIRESFEKAVA